MPDFGIILNIERYIKEACILDQYFEFLLIWTFIVPLRALKIKPPLIFKAVFPAF